MKRTIALWLCMVALLLVLPTAFADLELDPTSISITVDGNDFDAGDLVEVSPGDEVTIEFDFTNTGPENLGHVIAIADANVIGLEGLPHTGECQGVNCDDGGWVLRVGETGHEEFTFTIPLNAVLLDINDDPALTDFTVSVSAFFDGFFDDVSSQTVPLPFSVVRNDIAVQIVDETAIVTGVSCVETTASLQFDIINIGTVDFTTDFAPELQVYNQAASAASFDNDTGEFIFSTTPAVHHEEELNPLTAGDRRTERVTIDISDLSTGSHRLYFYLVNPYFDEAAFFIGDQDSAAFTTINCISSFSPSAASVNVLQSTATSFSVVPSDSSLENSVTWTVTRAGTDVDTVTGTDTYTFNQATTGTYTVRVELGAESHTWTVTVAAPAPAALSIAPITIDNVRAGQTANATITVTNTGANMNIGSLTAVLEGVNTRYQALIVGTLPATLAAGASSTALQIQLTVPTDEASGAHTIGNLVVRGTDAAGTAVNATQAISLNPRSFLTIESVKLNGKSGGDLTLEEANEFDVEVKNTYTQDINDIKVTVTILDVDGDDIEEESESFDLGDGKDDTITVSFDFSGENVDESQYTVQIEVEGEADDGTEHRTVQTITVDVERENHQVIVQKATLGSSTLQCSRQTSLQVIVENIGENDEDDVEIKVKNVPLGIDLSKTNIELDKFSGSDNEYRTTFNLNFEDAVAGSHTLTVEVYRDGSVDDTEEVPVQISSCSTTSATTGQTPVQAGAADSLAAELQRQLSAREQGEEGQEVQGSFRQSDSYVMLLGALAVLMFIAVVMAIAVLVVKKR